MKKITKLSARWAAFKVVAIHTFNLILKSILDYIDPSYSKKTEHLTLDLAPSPDVTIQYVGDDRQILPFREARQVFERTYVDAVLKKTRGNVTKAAELADKDRKDFYDLMRRAGISPRTYRPDSPLDDLDKPTGEQILESYASTLD